MSNTGIVIADERTSQMAKGGLGKDLNYQPFSSWYGSVKEKLETSDEITETIFFQALEHIGAVSRKNGATFPPDSIYEVMRGVDGEPKVSWYCKKYSNVKNDYVESYGICLDGIHKFEEKYLQNMIDILTNIEVEVQMEKENAEDWRAAMKEKSPRSKYKRITSQAKAMVREAKDFIVREAFKKGDDNE